jgi:hypothetical protein
MLVLVVLWVKEKVSIRTLGKLRESCHVSELTLAMRKDKQINRDLPVRKFCSCAFKKGVRRSKLFVLIFVWFLCCGNRKLWCSACCLGDLKHKDFSPNMLRYGLCAVQSRHEVGLLSR